jgi:nicotinamide mononucleotide transporter
MGAIGAVVAAPIFGVARAEFRSVRLSDRVPEPRSTPHAAGARAAAPLMGQMDPRPSKAGPADWAAIAAVSAVVMTASIRGWWPIPVTEALGFITGGACVWLIVRESLWNWPIGLSNNVLFFVLFYGSRLYADMGLQVLYFALGVYGWWNWLHRGTPETRLPITRTSRVEWIGIAVALVAGTWALREILLAVNGAAPFWDALTTMISLSAQYLLARKRIENWLLWMVVDVIYIPLYTSRGLPLTAGLYALFFLMCATGWKSWRRIGASRDLR